MELFEEIRREYEFGIGTIKGVAKKLGVHRRMVRQAVANALPPNRKLPERKRTQLDPVTPFINAILEADRKAPRNKGTPVTGSMNGFGRSCRISRLQNPAFGGTWGKRKREMGFVVNETFVPQTYAWGQEAQTIGTVDEEPSLSWLFGRLSLLRSMM